jgi:hypothetical protein
MPQIAVLGALLALVFAFFAPAVQRGVQAAFARNPRYVFVAPVLLTLCFAAAATMAGACTPKLVALVFAYTLAPTFLIYLQPGRADFIAILLLWIPIEFGAGASSVPLRQQGFLHSVAYGVAILLGLTLFLGFRRLDGMKFNLPRDRRDLWLPLIGYAVLAPVLIAVGVAIGFIPLPHAASQSAGKMIAAIGIIFAGTALPEEILFRALIQNVMMQRWGENFRTLFWASLIFGCAHLDNGPQPTPNWRYMIVATIAGIAYGRVFWKARSVVSSAILHLMVDWTKHFFF